MLTCESVSFPRRKRRRWSGTNSHPVGIWRYDKQ